MEPLFIVSHHVHRFHNLLVPEPGRITLAHRRKGAHRTFDARAWGAISDATRRPATEGACVAALVAAGSDQASAAAEVRALVDGGWLVERAADLGDLSSLDLGPPAAPEDLARDRLRWSRDALDTHALWLYPRWLGFPLLQLPEDLIWMQMLLAELRPAFVIETGVLHGGSAIFYASILALLGRGRVIAVEARLDPRVRAAIAAHPLGERITLLEGDSKDPAIVAQVSALVGGPGGHLVALDADHSATHVRAELEAYAPLVGPGGKLVVFDTSMVLASRWKDDNPHQAVRAFLAAHAEWRVSPWAGASFVTAAEDGILERLPALRSLDDTALLAALRALYSPGAPAVDEAALCAELRGREVAVEVPGGRLWVDLGDWTSLLVVRLGAWEPHLTRLCKRLLAPGQTALDVGAHSGAYALLFASCVGPAGRVVAFEPHGPSVALLRRSVAGLSQVEVVAAAVSEHEGRAELFAWNPGDKVSEGRYSGSDRMLRSLLQAEGYGAAGEEVPVTTLDAWAAQSGCASVDLVKIDVEGAEEAVLRGGRGLLSRGPVRVLLELHPGDLPAAGSSVAQVLAELREQGFEVLDLVPAGDRIEARPLAPGALPVSQHVLAQRGGGGFEVSLVDGEVKPLAADAR